MPTLADIERVARDARGSAQSHLNCGPVSAQIRQALVDAFGIDATVVDGSVTPPRRRGHGAEHAFVKIPQSEVEDAAREVIVDGTLDQFCEENREDGIVFVSLGPRDAFERVEVLAPSTETGWSSRDRRLYEAYSETPPI